MTKQSYKPITTPDSIITSYRQKLMTLVRRMKSDYEQYLSPLIEKMTNEQKKQIKEKQLTDIENHLVTDAVKYFTAYEVSRLMGLTKREVVQDCRLGHIKGAIQDYQNNLSYTSTKKPIALEWLIPETSLTSYKKYKGMYEEPSLMDKFNDRLSKLRRKYQDIIHIYQSMAESEAMNAFKSAKEQFQKQFKDVVGINVTKILAESGLEEIYKMMVKENVKLISNIPQDYLDKISTAVHLSITGQKKIEQGLEQYIKDLGKEFETRAKLIARDQTSKAISAFTKTRLQNIGVHIYCWRNSRDKRVAGNPSGFYPNADDKSKYHGNHWNREGKYFFFEPTKEKVKGPDGKWVNQPPPDGSPGFPVNCRCVCVPYIPEYEEKVINKPIPNMLKPKMTPATMKQMRKA